MADPLCWALRRHLGWHLGVRIIHRIEIALMRGICALVGTLSPRGKAGHIPDPGVVADLTSIPFGPCLSVMASKVDPSPFAQLIFIVESICFIIDLSSGQDLAFSVFELFVRVDEL